MAPTSKTSSTRRATPADSPAAKPNIFVVWGDDIGISNLSCYSDGLMSYRTSNIDRLASEGMRFTDSYGEQSCIVSQFLETFKEFPPRQKSASFTIDQALDKMTAAAAGGGR
jgi:hypothetical protein